MENILQEKLERIERIVTLTVSADAEAKASKENTTVDVTMVIEAGFTVQQIIDRFLEVTTSPRVGAQAALRKLEKIPSEFTFVVPMDRGAKKLKTKEERMVEQLVQLLGNEKAQKLIEKRGVLGAWEFAKTFLEQMEF